MILNFYTATLCNLEMDTKGHSPMRRMRRRFSTMASKVDAARGFDVVQRPRCHVGVALVGHTKMVFDEEIEEEIFCIC